MKSATASASPRATVFLHRKAGRGPRASLARVPPRTSWTALGVTALAAALIGIDLGARTLITNDDARFALLARAILGGADRLFPALNGDTYVNKPPLQAWLIALVSWPGHAVTQFTAVVPAAVAAVATVYAILVLGRDLFGRRAGLYAALMALTSQGLLLHARLPLPDMLLTFTTTASVLALTRAEAAAPGPWWLAFQLAVAAGFWTKGAPGLLPLAVALLYGARHRQALRALQLPRGLIVLGALVAPWWILALLRHPAEAQRALVNDQILWYAPGLMPNGLPLAIPHVFGIVFPWVVVTPFALWSGIRSWRRHRTDDTSSLLVLTWLAVEVTAVCLSGHQRFRYYLVVLPPLALLIGRWFAEEDERSRTRRWAWRWWAAAAAAASLAFAVWRVTGGAWSLHDELALPASSAEALSLAAGLAAALAASTYAVAQRRSAATFAIACAGSAFALTVGYHGQVQRENAAFDGDGLERRLAPVLRGVNLTGVWGVPVLPAVFYFGRPLRAVESERDMRRVLAPPGSALLVTADALARHAPRIDVVPIARDRWGGQPLWLVQQRAPGDAAGPAWGELGAVPSLRPTVRAGVQRLAGRLTGAAASAQYHLDGRRERLWELGCVILALAGLALRRRREPVSSLGEVVIAVAWLLFTRLWVRAVLLLAIPVAIAVIVAARLGCPAPVPLRCRRGYGLGLVLTIPVFLDAIEDIVESRHFAMDLTWVPIAVVGLVLLATTRRRRSAVDRRERWRAADA